MNIYKLSEEARALSLALDSDSSEESLSQLQAEVEAHAEAFQAKAESIIHIIKEAEADARALKEAEAEIRAKRQREENKVSRLKGLLHLYLTAKGSSSEKAGLWTIAIQKNGGKPPLRVSCDPADLPEEYRRVIVEADNDKIRDHLEMGVLLDFAEIEEVGTHLRIR